ncbi:MAG: hypothetical protein ACXAB2_13175 [Candidatus Hodarchaeales archaeon]|jgi:hypothetical protein
MATQEENTDKTHENKKIINDDYLIRKYGKEPPITEKERKQNQWNWH